MHKAEETGGGAGFSLQVGVRVHGFFLPVVRQDVYAYGEVMADLIVRPFNPKNGITPMS